MEVKLKKEPKVRISYDEMEAYLLLPEPITEEAYELNDIMSIVEKSGVKINLDQEKIKAK